MEYMQEQIETQEADLNIRMECEEKVNQMVTELISKNQELTNKLDFVK